MDIITQQTGISIALAISLIGGAVWMTKLWAQSKDNKETLAQLAKTAADRHKALEVRIGAIESENNQMLERIVRIETKIDLLLDKWSSKP